MSLLSAHSKITILKKELKEKIKTNEKKKNPVSFKTKIRKHNEVAKVDGNKVKSTLKVHGREDRARTALTWRGEQERSPCIKSNPY